MTRHARLFVPSLVTAGLVAGAFGCASAHRSSPPGPGTARATANANASTGANGWLDGEPDWHGSTAVESVAAGGAGTTAGAASAAATAASPVMAAPSGDVAADGPADLSDSAPRSAQALRAGSVDDNADFAAFVDYLHRIEGLGIRTRAFDPTGRIVVSVVGTSGRPVHGAAVTVSAGQKTVATLRTGTDGTARFLPALYGAEEHPSYTFSSGGSSTTANPGGTAELRVAAAGGASGRVRLDVLFLLDATGSMGDEIGRLKTTIDSVAGRIASLEQAPDVRFATTLYRDLGDTFVTSTFDFTGDVEAFRGALADVAADGGGDYPEALDEGLAAALTEPSWRDPSETVQLVFLVADAPAHVDRQVATPYTRSLVDAVARGITIVPIASSESDDAAEAVFRQLAEPTGGRFVFLSYGAGGAATGANSDIDRTDYEELALDDLVVRLVSEKLAALDGPTGTRPVPASLPTTATTFPPGQ